MNRSMTWVGGKGAKLELASETTDKRQVYPFALLLEFQNNIKIVEDPMQSDFTQVHHFDALSVGRHKSSGPSGLFLHCISKIKV